MRRTVQRGASLITAIFLLVVVAALGALIAPFFAAQQQSSTLDVLGAQAYQAARTGILWGTYQITQSNVIPSSTFASDCIAGTNPSTTQPTLTNYTLTVYCTSASSAMSSGTTLYVYNIIASAVAANAGSLGSADYIERAMQATVSVSGVNTGVYQRETY